MLVKSAIQGGTSGDVLKLLKLTDDVLTPL